jgi:hypothetical protein
MKKNLYIKYAICFGVLLVFLNSCFLEAREFDIRFSILNESTVVVQLDLFETNGEFSRSIVIEPNEVYFDERTFKTRSFLENPNNNAIIRGESAVFIFNDERFMEYSFSVDDNNVSTFSTPINRNIFRIGSYENLGDEDFLYTITQEDFENALPCDEPCE